MAARRPQQYSALLRVRKRQEDLKAMALATAWRAVRDAERLRAEIEAHQRRVLAIDGEASQRTVYAERLRRLVQYERHLARLAVDKDADIEDLTKKADGRRSELEDAMKQRRIVERLIENAEEALQEEIAKNERAVNDEIATMRVGRALIGKRSEE